MQSMMSLLVTVTDFAKLSVTIIQGLRPSPKVEISAIIKLVAADGAGSVYVMVTEQLPQSKLIETAALTVGLLSEGS